MLISDSHEFIFIHVRKAAGSSLRQQLAQYALPRPAGSWNRIFSRMTVGGDYRRHVFRAHAPLDHAVKLMPGQLFKRYFKFAFVRNPWDRLVSEYEYIRQNKEHARHKKVSSFSSFYDFVDYQRKRPDAYQLPMLTDVSGQPKTDFLGRFESLQQDFENVCRQLNIACTPLPCANPSQRTDYREYYDSRSADLVSKHWQDEIKYFNYSFE